MTDQFTPVRSTLGGLLIGLASVVLLLSHGKIAGISGIVGGLLTRPDRADVAWRVSFFAGLLAVGAAAAWLQPSAFATMPTRSLGALALAGLLVGFGTRLGNGCTSGHGVCGVSRLSPRSLVATAVFMACGALAVFVVQQLLGGRV